jgi:hypothetical protein
MIPNTENYIEKINAFTQQDWKPLLDLIPELEKTKKFGEFQGPTEDEAGVLTFPFCLNGPLIDRFLDIVYQMPIIINFNWGGWDEGRNMARNPDFDYNTIDIPTKCKLITAIVRNDRFCEGALAEAFESGWMLKVLKSIKQQLGMKG